MMDFTKPADLGSATADPAKPPDPGTAMTDPAKPPDPGTAMTDLAKPPSPGGSTMDPQRPPDLSRVRDEHCNRLYDRFDRKSRSLHQLSKVLAVFSALYLVFILCPYVLMQRESRSVEAKLERLRAVAARVGQLQARQEAYRKAEEGLEALQGSIRQDTEALKAAIGRLGEGQPWLELPPEDPCPAGSPEQWLDCTARERLFQQFRGYLAMLGREGAAPQPEPPGPSLEASFQQVLASHPTLWTAVREDGQVAARVDEAAWRGFWTKQLDEVRKEAAALKAELEALRRQLGGLEKEQQRLESQQKDVLERQARLEKRLAGLESPLGRLPLSLDESFQVFPAILAVGFVVCAGLLRDALRLRQSFHRIYMSKDSTGAILDDHQVVLIAPLLIDPADQDQSWIGRSAVLFLPFVVFVASVTLIVYSWTLGRGVPVLGSTHLWTFGGLYALCFVLFVYGCGRVIIELRHYRSELHRPHDEGRAG